MSKLFLVLVMASAMTGSLAYGMGRDRLDLFGDRRVFTAAQIAAMPAHWFGKVVGSVPTGNPYTPAYVPASAPAPAVVSSDEEDSDDGYGGGYDGGGDDSPMESPARTIDRGSRRSFDPRMLPSSGYALVPTTKYARK